MPEAPIHEDASPIFPQHQVRMARQSPMVQPISESPTPQPPTHNHFRLRILRMNRCHILVPLLGRVVVHKSFVSYLSAKIQKKEGKRSIQQNNIPIHQKLCQGKCNQLRYGALSLGILLTTDDVVSSEKPILNHLSLLPYQSV